VIGAAGSQGTLGPWCGRNSRRARRLFLEHAGYGAFGDFPAAASEGLCDAEISAEAGEPHGVDELADDVGVAANRGLRVDESPFGVGLSGASRFSFPTGDGAWSEPEEASSLLRGEGQQSLEPQDAVAELGGVLRAVSIGNLVPAEAEDLGGFLEEEAEEVVLLALGESDLPSLAGVSLLGELEAEGQAEELIGFEDGAERELGEVAALDEREEDTVGEGG